MRGDRSRKRPVMQLEGGRSPSLYTVQINGQRHPTPLSDRVPQSDRGSEYDVEIVQSLLGIAVLPRIIPPMEAVLGEAGGRGKMGIKRIVR